MRHGWSPEQNAGRLKRERSGTRVCHESIYRFVHSREGREHKPWYYLPERCARRGHRRRFSLELSILHHPDIVRERCQLAHWECDLIQFRQKFGKAKVASLVKRVSRFTIFSRNNDRQSRPIMQGLIGLFARLPQIARRSITFDRGTEFADWPYLQAGLGVQTCFPLSRDCVPDTDRQTAERRPAHARLYRAARAPFSGGHDQNAGMRRKTRRLSWRSAEKSCRRSA